MKRHAFLPRLARELVPPPRHAWRWWSSWPLALVAAALLLLWPVGEAMAWVLWTDPRWFALVVLAIPVWHWHRAGWLGLPPGRAAVALCWRLALLVVAAAALAGPRAVRQGDGLAVVFAVDISHSVPGAAQDAAFDYVADSVGTKREGDQVGLVVFGRDAAVELPPRESYAYEGAVNSLVGRDGTDLAEALSLAAAVLPDDAPGRVVLATDGAATAGALDPVLADLAGRGVAVDVLPVDYRLDKEVWVEKLALPKRVKAEETYEAAVVLNSLTAGEGTLVLRENGQVIAEEAIQWPSGRARFSLPLRLRGPGYYEYTATIQPGPGQDHWADNNTGVGHLHLEGEGRVLVLIDPEGDVRDSQTLVGALREAGRAVTVQPSWEGPRDALGYMPYDLVALVDVPADRFDAVQQTALTDAVYHLGTGLIVVGGENTYGPGGYSRSPLEEALPVSTDISNKKVMPKGALVVVLHTCEFPQGNTWGKRVAKQAIRVLSRRDEAGVLVFDWNNGANWLFPLTPVSEYASMATQIEGAQIGDMPSFAPTMQLAQTALSNSDASARHIIIISDGDPSPPPPAVLQAMQNDRISVTTVTVFPHGSQDPPLMQSISNATGGRHYYPTNANQLPSIFIKEAKTLRRSMIQEFDFTPEIGFPHPVLKGVDALPPLHGYVITTLKPRARSVLVHTTSDDEQDPILAVWRYGLGQVAALTTDLAPRWAVDWTAWDGYRPFVEQLAATNSRVERPSHLGMLLGTDGDRGTILIEDHHPDGGLLEFRATVRAPDGGEHPLSIEAVGPGRYAATFPLAGRGRYSVVVAGAGAERSEQLIDTLVVPYAPEYLRFRADPITLQRIAQATGGRELSGDFQADQVFAVPRDPRAASRPIFDWLLLALLILLPLDVALRRVQVDLAALAFWRSRDDHAPATATLGQLLQRKKRAAPPPRERPPLLKGQPRAAASEPTRAPGVRPDIPTATPADPPAASGGTMERLLARKRAAAQQHDRKNDDE